MSEAAVYRAERLAPERFAAPARPVRTSGQWGRGGEMALEASALCAGYGGGAPDAVRDVDLGLPAGELVAVVGPNGAGKSTLLKLFMGLMHPRHGRLTVLGGDPAEVRRSGAVAYMPQHEAIDWDFPATVREVVFSARYGHLRRAGGWRRFMPRRWAGSEHREALERALSAVAMTDRGGSHIGTLSGGQKKRVLLARSLAQDARLLLLDEPLVGVDGASEALIFQVMRDLRREGRTVVLVTHDVAAARRHADRVILFNRTVVASGPPDEVLTDELLLLTADPLLARAGGSGRLREVRA